MKRSFAPRAACLVASILVTFGAVKAIAEYAYPAAARVQMACTARCSHPSPELGRSTRGI